MRAVLLALAIAAVMAAAFAIGNVGAASAQTDAACEATDLGSLDSGNNSRLDVEGRWTTEDCDSMFLADSDAHNYKFEITEAGQVRIELSSVEGDPYLHLLAEDGTRLAHDDDTGPAVDARLEVRLDAGVYFIEAASGSGRVRGPADYALSVRRVTNCDPIDLGVLTADEPLTAVGEWTVDSCGARFRDDTPALTYRFGIREEATVRIDLAGPELSDPFLYLLTADGEYIYSDDDDGPAGDARIENDLPAGSYLLEATTWGDREHAHELVEFTLTIRMVDEDGYNMKAEAIHVSEPVVVGQPVTVHYRVGNAGRSDMPEDYSAIVYVGGRNASYYATERIPASDGFWKAGASYHSGEPTAIGGSALHDDLKTPQITFRRSGYAWAYVGILIDDEEEEEVDFHWIWKELTVLEGFVFDPVTVTVDGLEYEVMAEADEEGEVTVSVTSVLTPDAEVLDELRAKALYSAGVQTQMLEGIFDRPAVASLPTTGDREATSVPSPSSLNLMKLFGNQYASALRDSGMKNPLLDGQSMNPVEVEELLLEMAETASKRAASLMATWKALDARVGDAAPISFEDAFGLHSQLFYGEKVLAPMVEAAQIVEAARAADEGWGDEGVQKMMEVYEDAYSCRRPASIAVPLRRAEVLDLAWMLTADAEMRAALPMYELAADAVLCGNGADDVNEQFFVNLFIDDNRAFMGLFDIAPPPAPAPAPYKLRILSRLGDDGRIEHGVEMSDGERIFPETRHLPADSAVDEWMESSEVMVEVEEEEEEGIGKIRSRRLEDGRVEVGYVTISGREVEPRVRYLPAEMPMGVWFRTSNVNAPRADDS